MIKKILPTMIGAALVGGMAPAVADVTVFGHLDTSVVYQDEADSTTNLTCNTCSLGFKGSEDLGNGLKAIFSLDFQFDMTERNTGQASSKSVNASGISTPSGSYTGKVVTSVSDTSSITDRDQWLGLAGNFGQVRIGTISTLYKSHGAMIDPVYRTAAQGRDYGIQSNLQRGAGESGQGRATNTFRYDSPSWNGLNVGATYTMQTDTGGNVDNPFGLGVEYKNGPFLVFADYITNDQGGDDDAYKLGGKYTFGNYAVFGQYEFDGGLISRRGSGLFGNAQSGTSGDGADVWFLGGTGTFGNNMIYAAYGQGDSTSGGNGLNNEYDSWEIVGVHSLSKRTSVYAAYVQVSPDASGADDQDTAAIGMKHKF